MSPVNLPVPATWETNDAEEFDGGGEIRDKQDLVRVPFLIGNIKFNKGEYGPFVSLTCVDTENHEFVFNDGSTGVYAQVVNHLHNVGKLDKKITKPDSQSYDVRLICRRGLRVSEYEGPQGKPARTYYIA